MRVIIFIIILLSFQAISGQTIAALRAQIQKFATDEELKNATISWYAYDLDSNKIVSGINSNNSLVPASTMKLVTTATALELLGPGKRFSTTIKYSGIIDTNCVLNGDIYIVGGGDPCLGSDRFSKQYEGFINKWANEIKLLGIDSINGRVIGDATYFNEQMIPATWIWGDLGNYYGAGPCGLSIYENKCEIEFESFDRGDSTNVTCIYPFVPNLEFDNYVKSMTTNDDESYIFGAPYQEERIIKGGIPTNEKNFMVRGSIPDPAYLAAFELDMELRALGIKMANPSTTVRKIKDNGDDLEEKVQKHIITTTRSPSVLSIINLTNMYSVNLYAEHLLNQIGVFKYGSGDTGSGSQAVANFWKEKGLDTDGLYVNDGSGLSRFNGVSAQHLVGILEYMYNSKNYKLFLSTLPVAGKSGTLINVGRGTAASGRVMAKSGTMTRVKSYAGYVTTKNKRHLAFAIIVNNHNCSSAEMKKKMEKVMIKLAEIND